MEVSDPSVRPGDPASFSLAVSFEAADGVPDDSDLIRAVVSGEIDVASAPKMQAQIEEARAHHGSTRVLLDLEGVQFMDSSGLRVIVSLHQELAAEKGSLVLLGATSEVRHILALTGLDGHLNIAQTPDQAQEMLANSDA